jgi:hypothetical protein
LVGTLLVRGMLVGIVAGLLSFGFLKVYGEPQVDRAIAFEAQLDEAKAAADKAKSPRPLPIGCAIRRRLPMGRINTQFDRTGRGLAGSAERGTGEDRRHHSRFSHSCSRCLRDRRAAAIVLAHRHRTAINHELKRHRRPLEPGIRQLHAIKRQCAKRLRSLRHCSECF